MRASKLRDFDDFNNRELDEIAMREDYEAEYGAQPEPPSHQPLTFCDLSAWARREPPEREWAVPYRFPLRNVGLLSGQGDTGKSILLMQLGAAHVLGKDWAGTLPEPGPFLYFNAEEEEDELHRRLAAIAEHYGASLSGLERDYYIVARAGQDAILGYPDRKDLIRPTPLLTDLEEMAREIRPKMIALDTAADIFGGNEISRTQVRQFIGLLRKLAIVSNSAVVIAVHPSLTGINSGTGLSGSTAWHNSVRARAYFRKPDVDEDDSEDNANKPDSGLRQLDFMKSNYSPIAASVTLQWKGVGQAGVYVPVSSGSGGLDKVAADAKADQVFLELLRRYTEQGREVSHKAGPSYAPALFAQEAAAHKIASKNKARKEALAAAMNRLFEGKKIKTESYGRPSRPYNKIVEQQQQ
jgi:RecA-family ATPase